MLSRSWLQLSWSAALKSGFLLSAALCYKNVSRARGEDEWRKESERGGRGGRGGSGNREEGKERNIQKHV